MRYQIYCFLLFINLLHRTWYKVGFSKEYSKFQKDTSRRNIKKNTYKKKLHRAILDNHDNSLLIHNLGKFHLKQSHIDVLSKGLIFVPTPKPTSLDDICSAFNKFRSRLYLIFHFLNKPLPYYYPFHLASTWEPPTLHSSCIEPMI